jgi:hypothetical protein
VLPDFALFTYLSRFHLAETKVKKNQSIGKRHFAGIRRYGKLYFRETATMGERPKTVDLQYPQRGRARMKEYARKLLDKSL